MHANTHESCKRNVNTYPFQIQPPAQAVGLYGAHDFSETHGLRQGLFPE